MSTSSKNPITHFYTVLTGLLTCSFVYGGTDGNLGAESVPYDTISILTLPAFRWVSVSYNPQNPRIGHTCHAVGGGQIAVVGGADANCQQVVGDFAAVGRSSFTRPDPFSQGLAIFDMNELQFVSRYTANGAAMYEQSDEIKAVYAGQTNGYVKTLRAISIRTVMALG